MIQMQSNLEVADNSDARTRLGAARNQLNIEIPQAFGSFKLRSSVASLQE